MVGCLHYLACEDNDSMANPDRWTIYETDISQVEETASVGRVFSWADTVCTHATSSIGSVSNCLPSGRSTKIQLLALASWHNGWPFSYVNRSPPRFYNNAIIRGFAGHQAHGQRLWVFSVSVLKLRAKRCAKATSARFGYYLQATVVPPSGIARFNFILITSDYSFHSSSRIFVF